MVLIHRFNIGAETAATPAFAALDEIACNRLRAIEVLKMAEDNQAADALGEYFHQFKKAYIAGKAHLTL